MLLLLLFCLFWLKQEKTKSYNSFSLMLQFFVLAENRDKRIMFLFFILTENRKNR